MKITRRDALKQIAVVSSAAALPSVMAGQHLPAGTKSRESSWGTFPYALPALPYAANALEPYIDTKTMEIHHGKHHAGYVKKLNLALEKHQQWADTPLEELLRSVGRLPESLQGAVRKHAGGHYNHSLFWTSLAPESASSSPSKQLDTALTRDFGSVENALDALKKQALSVFGSGWAWLVVSPFGRITITGTPNQENPVMDGKTPLLGIDVWEHAYYLNYQNRRGDYLDAVFNILNWPVLSTRFEAAKSL